MALPRGSIGVTSWFVMACCESCSNRGPKSCLNKIVAKWVELRLFAEAC
jgi:hypothetical protein